LPSKARLMTDYRNRSERLRSQSMYFSAIFAVDNKYYQPAYPKSPRSKLIWLKELLAMAFVVSFVIKEDMRDSKASVLLG
jgi:hypothetical protein